LSAILVLVFFMFLTAGMIAADQPDQKTVKQINKLMKKAEKSIKKNEFDKAMEHYNKALALNTEYAPLHFAMAQMYDKQKKFDDAIAGLEKAVTLQPDLAPAVQMLTKTLMGLGRNMAQQRQPEKSNKYYLKMLEIPAIQTAAKDQYLIAAFQAGINYTQLQELTKANECLAKVLAVPDALTLNKKAYVNSIYQSGLNYFNLKKYKKADEYFSKILGMEEQLKPEFLRVLSMSIYLTGVNANQMGEIEKSNKALLRYLELTKENPSDQFAPVANYMVGSNNFDLLEKEVAPIKDDKKEKEKKTKIAAVAKKHTDIAPYLEKAIQANPKLEPAYMTLGNYYYYCKELEKAIQVYQQLVDKFPGARDAASYKTFLESLKKEIQVEKKK
jgi:tetratricopeptide (TPR) repeat protein